jgi:hypothetical protein
MYGNSHAFFPFINKRGASELMIRSFSCLAEAPIRTEFSLPVPSTPYVATCSSLEKA